MTARRADWLATDDDETADLWAELELRCELAGGLVRGRAVPLAVYQSPAGVQLMATIIERLAAAGV